MYWVWDTTNSQKNRFRAREKGKAVTRKAFPQLPWREVENPRIIKTKSGDTILVDGMYGYARKIHYTCDLYFALTWGFITGFSSPFPWFYPLFFSCMIVHRAYRDIERCKLKYGESWTEYEKLVPYLFIPVRLCNSFPFHDLISHADTLCSMSFRALNNFLDIFIWEADGRFLFWAGPGER
jgi:delta24(24(1))-sterol reductase